MNEVNVDVGDGDDSKPGIGVPVKRGAHPYAVIDIRCFFLKFN